MKTIQWVSRWIYKHQHDQWRVIERWSHFVFKCPDVRYRAVGTSCTCNITLGSVIIALWRRILPTSREASPISKDHQWQLLFIEVTDGLGSFIGRVWVPHLTCLGYDLKRIGINIKLGRKLAPHQSILRKALWLPFPCSTKSRNKFHGCVLRDKLGLYQGNTKCWKHNVPPCFQFYKL